MPKIYKYFGFFFAFYVNEHTPVHVHVTKQQRESKIELFYGKYGLELTAKRIGESKPLTTKELNEAKDFIRKYHLQIVHKWNQVFIFNERITCEEIKKKV